MDYSHQTENMSNTLHKVRFDCQLDFYAKETIRKKGKKGLLVVKTNSELMQIKKGIFMATG
jgi:hypothetical protein